MHTGNFISNTLYFLILINPFSKIFFLTAQQPALTYIELRSISFRSTRFSLIVLAIMILMGNFILETIFHVAPYSLDIAGGIILFGIGLNAVKQGTFHSNSSAAASLGSDFVIVPLAMPLIVGPGIITAVLAETAKSGVLNTMICASLALFINWFCMLFSVPFGHFLDRYHASAPIVRIIGLIITTMGMQMILTGIKLWLAA